MTTYTAIPDGDIDPESPGTTTLFTRLRDNPLAIAEGDASAPKIAYNALGPPSVSGGIAYMIAEVSSGSSSSLSYEKLVEWQVSLAGTVNVYFGLSVSVATSVYARIYVNGSPVGTERTTTSSSPVYFSEDISISNGDLVQIYSKTSAPSFPSIITGATLRNSAPIPGSIVKIL